jgi:CRP-like cAMP-binding protein
MQHLGSSSPQAGSNPDRPECAALWQPFAGASTQHHYPPGTELYGQAQLPRLVYRLDEGLVKLLHRRRNGQELVVAIRMAGSPLGITAAVLGRPTHTTAMTLTRCSVTAVSAAAFVQRLWSDLSLLRHVVNLQSVATREYLDRLSLLTCVPAKQRLELFLHFLGRTLGSASNGRLRFRLPLTQTELAQVINVTPETLSRILADLERERVICRTNGWISIQPPDRAGTSTIQDRLARPA